MVEPQRRARMTVQTVEGSKKEWLAVVRTGNILTLLPTQRSETYRRKVRAMVVVEPSPFGKCGQVVVKSVVKAVVVVKAVSVSPHEHCHGDSSFIVVVDILVVVVSRTVVVLWEAMMKSLGKGSTGVRRRRMRRLLLPALLRQRLSVGSRCRRCGRGGDGGPRQRPTLRGGGAHDRQQPTTERER